MFKTNSCSGARKIPFYIWKKKNPAIEEKNRQRTCYTLSVHRDLSLCLVSFFSFLSVVSSHVLFLNDFLLRTTTSYSRLLAWVVKIHYLSSLVPIQFIILLPNKICEAGRRINCPTVLLIHTFFPSLIQKKTTFISGHFFISKSLHYFHFQFIYSIAI